MGKKCTVCSKENLAQAKFCAQCGSKLDVNNEYEPSKASAGTETKPKYKIYVAIAIVFLVGASLGSFFMMKMNAQSKDIEKAIPAQTITDTNKNIQAEQGNEKTAMAQSYKTYTNARYGFSISYPANFIEGKSPTNGDGLRFTSPDNQATLSAAGGNVGNLSTRDMYEMSKRSIKGTIGYNVLEDTWYVLTWKENGKVFYRKDFVGSKSHNGFTFSYPESMRGQYEPIVEELERSFKRGNTEQGH